MESLGSLIDKLTIVNIKCFMQIDIHADRNNSDPVRLKAADTVRELNSQRNELVEEINELLYKTINGEAKTPHKLIKMYKDGLKG